MLTLTHLAAYISVGLSGAIRLIKLDSQGLDYFGDTNADFWRSFLAAAVVAPLFLLYLVIRYVGSNTDGSLTVYISAQMLAYVIAWLAFPLVMLYLAPVLQKEDKVVRYLVAYNWLSVIQNGAYLPVVMLGITGAFAQGLSNFLAMITLMWVLGITLFVTRKALEVPFGTAAGIVVVDLLLGVLVEVLTSRPG